MTSKTALLGGITTIHTTDYLNGFQYFDGTLEFFATSEGYVKNTEDGGHHFNYVYNYTDHLGNVRLSYGYDPREEVVKILEENNYYAYGLKHQNYNMNKATYEKNEGHIGIRDLVTLTGAEYNYKYNGKEWQGEFGLNMYDMDFRDFDPAIARWVVIDPVDHYGQSPYNGYDSNPVFFADPSGANTSFEHWMQGVEEDWDAIDRGANPFDVFRNRTNADHQWAMHNKQQINVLIDALTGDLGPRGPQVARGEVLPDDAIEVTDVPDATSSDGTVYPDPKSFKFRTIQGSGKQWQESAVVGMYFNVSLVTIGPGGVEIGNPSTIFFAQAISFTVPTNLTVGDTDITSEVAGQATANIVNRVMSRTAKLFAGTPATTMQVEQYFRAELKKEYQMSIPGARVNFNSMNYSVTPTVFRHQ